MEIKNVPTLKSKTGLGWKAKKWKPQQLQAQKGEHKSLLSLCAWFLSDDNWPVWWELYISTSVQGITESPIK